MSFEEREKEINDLYPRGYRFIRCINMYRDIVGDHSSRFNIEIFLLNDSGEEARIVACDCIDFSIGNVNNMLAAFVEVFDVSKDQIDGAKYKIVESENNLFSALCLDFKVIV